MIGRAGRAASMCLLVALAMLTLATAGCERAKPARVVALPPAFPREETPVVARIVVATPTDVRSVSYPAPEPVASATPTEAATEPTALPEQPATPTATPMAPPTDVPTAVPPTAAPSASPAPSATPVTEVVYRVKPGDSLGAIAVLYNTTAAAIMRRNGLSDPSLIQVGQTLIIPTTNTEITPRGSTVLHTVGSGETLASIALRYRTTPEAILEQNPSVTDPEHPPVGAVLTITIGSEPGNRTHVVRPGERLGTIAESYGVTTQELARANGLTDPSRVRVGQTLIIP